MSKKLFTVFITKYALTKGIYEVEVRETNYPDIVSETINRWPQIHHKSDWHLTKEEAIKRAEEMRIKKLKSLDKQIKKLSALKFE